MEEITITEEGRIFIDRPIRRIIIPLKTSEMYYASPQIDKSTGKEIISLITQDKEAFLEKGDMVYYLWRKNSNGEAYCWKKFYNVPMIVEYDDDFFTGEKKEVI